MIDEQNYEAYLLQYHDGTLDVQRAREVEAFLLQHPQIAWEDRQYYSDAPIAAPLDSNYLYKAFLKQQPAQSHKGWYWAAAACVVGLLATVWLWGVREESGPRPIVAQSSICPQEVLTPTADKEPSQHVLKTTVPPASMADAQVRLQQPHQEEQMFQEAEVGQVNVETVADAAPQAPTAPMLCESDQLVVYGCPTVNSSSLVQCSEQQPVCNNFVCRLLLTGRRLGML